MHDLSEDDRADMALREGLRKLPVPSTSSAFDARIQSALSRPLPWWHALWPTLRPVLTTGFCSLLVTLALLHWSAQNPIRPQPGSGSAATDILAVNSMAEGDLSRATLRGVPPPRRISRAATPPPEKHQPVLDRRSQLLPSPSV